MKHVDCKCLQFLSQKLGKTNKNHKCQRLFHSIYLDDCVGDGGGGGGGGSKAGQKIELEKIT